MYVFLKSFFIAIKLFKHLVRSIYYYWYDKRFELFYLLFIGLCVYVFISLYEHEYPKCSIWNSWSVVAAAVAVGWFHRSVRTTLE